MPLFNKIGAALLFQQVIQNKGPELMSRSFLWLSKGPYIDMGSQRTPVSIDTKSVPNFVISMPGVLQLFQVEGRSIP